MTKELSKKLCEIVGIEPERTCDGCKNQVEDWCNGSYNSWCGLDKDNLYNACEDSKYTFPDFGKPENFVKLLNIVLKIGINEVCDFQPATMNFSQENYSIEGETFEEIWLNCLLCELEPHNPDSWERKYSEMLKQAIREEKWEYE